MVPNGVIWTSSILGFISFSLILLTFLRIFWSEFVGIQRAPREVHAVLGNLRQELYEERDHLRQARRKCRNTPYDEESLRLMSDGLRDMIRDFKALERPFLKYPLRGDPEEKGEYGGYDRVDYKEMDLWRRIVWTKERGSVMGLADRLQKLQTRRVGKQVNDMMSAMNNMERTSGDIDVYTLNEKLSQVVGIRRVA